MKTIYLLFILTLNIYASSVEVSVIQPQIANDTMSIEANGVVIPKNKKVLTARTTGVLKLFSYDNASVKKGEKIAYIKDERRTRNLQLLKQKLQIQTKELQFQQKKLDDEKEKFHMGVSSKNAWLGQKIALEQLRELYNNTKKEYELLKLEEKNATIAATEDTTLVNLLAQNSYVTYGMPLATLLTQDTLVKLFIDAQYVHKLKKKMQVKLHSTYADTKGTITAILPISANNLSEVIVMPQIQLPQNLQVNANIILKNYRGVFIPKDAIVLVDNAPAVYIIKGDTAHLKFVEIIKDMVNRVLIKNTLPKDAKIALKNAYMLHDNLKVITK